MREGINNKIIRTPFCDYKLEKGILFYNSYPNGGLPGNGNEEWGYLTNENGSLEIDEHFSNGDYKLLKKLFNKFFIMKDGLIPTNQVIALNPYQILKNSEVTS
tara:strand:- start:621 stop:929 length:309 start_codon:yes stop_codon:yes gene_type:complete